MKKISVNLIEAFQADLRPDSELDNYIESNSNYEHSQEILNHKVPSEVSFKIGNNLSSLDDEIYIILKI